MTADFRVTCTELIEAVLSDDSHIDCVQIARRARALMDQPRSPSLKKEALEQLRGISTCFLATHGGHVICDKILAALEQLND